MPLRKYVRDNRGRFASTGSSTKKQKTKQQALDTARGVMKTRNTFKRASPNPAFGAKVASAELFLKHHGKKLDNAEATRVTRGIKDVHGKIHYTTKRRPGPGRGH